MKRNNFFKEIILKEYEKFYIILMKVLFFIDSIVSKDEKKDLL